MNLLHSIVMSDIGTCRKLRYNVLDNEKKRLLKNLSTFRTICYYVVITQFYQPKMIQELHNS